MSDNNAIKILEMRVLALERKQAQQEESIHIIAENLRIKRIRRLIKQDKALIKGIKSDSND